MFLLLKYLYVQSTLQYIHNNQECFSTLELPVVGAQRFHSTIQNVFYHQPRLLSILTSHIKMPP